MWDSWEPILQRFVSYVHVLWSFPFPGPSSGCRAFCDPLNQHNPLRKPNSHFLINLLPLLLPLIRVDQHPLQAPVETRLARGSGHLSLCCRRHLKAPPTDAAADAGPPDQIPDRPTDRWAGRQLPLSVCTAVLQGIDSGLTYTSQNTYLPSLTAAASSLLAALSAGRDRRRDRQPD